MIIAASSLVEERCWEIQHLGMKLMTQRYQLPQGNPGFVEVADKLWRMLYDEALELVHYSGSCQRVGRCMRLAIIDHGEWVGGIVLGSTFPNIFVRDESLGLRKFVTDYRERGLSHPWSRQNRLYWSNLQKVVNHARTFIFPQFQGRGLGILSHAELLTTGMRMWEEKYKEQVYALDTLCTANESKLFLSNGWIRAGQTKGYSADKSKILSKAVGVKNDRDNGIKNNVGLSEGDIRWWVWVVQFKAFT
jgi:hypothetical protein